MSPQFVPPVPFIRQQPHHFQNANPPTPTLLTTQPIPNPNNKPNQSLNSIELQTLPMYLILTIPVHEIELRSGRVVNDKPKSSVIIQEPNEEEEDSNEPMDDVILEDVNIPKVPLHTQPPQETIQEQRVPPFPERLVIEKPVVHPEYNILNELKNICIKIPLLQAIKDIQIYSKVIKKLCIKRQERSKTTLLQFML